MNSHTTAAPRPIHAAAAQTSPALEDVDQKPFHAAVAAGVQRATPLSKATTLKGAHQKPGEGGQGRPLWVASNHFNPRLKARSPNTADAKRPNGTSLMADSTGA